MEMTTPMDTLRLFLAALTVGCGVGLWYSFLRPLPRHLRDLLWLCGLFYGWIWHSFALCRGDIRMGHAVGILLGAFGWYLTAGEVFHSKVRSCYKLFRQLGKHWCKNPDSLLKGKKMVE